MRLLIVTFFVSTAVATFAQEGGYVSKVWVSDQQNGNYRNPILHADYSDPDVCRVGDDYYMVSSSFNCVPGLPILHSTDLVNWHILTYALPRQVPIDHFRKSQHGNGVWAPSIRYHDGEFYIYYPDPDFGIYLIKAKNASGPWSEPVLVEPGKGLIDPCPLWDDDGKNYLVHAFAGSRAGIKSVLVVKELNADGTRTIDEGRIVYDGHQHDPTVEGPKFYKRNGYYYIFAPAGGVATGWQIALRSKNIYGPYERKVVMHQGKTEINGPHQGAWVTSTTDEDWFIHFQDKEAYGRVVHLQPMVWKNDWPVIGADKDGDGTGEPVLEYRKPAVKNRRVRNVETPPESDEFSGSSLGPQWQWHANPHATWSFINDGKLRLYTQQMPEGGKNLWHLPNLLLQKFPAPQFTTTTRIVFHPNEKLQNETVGLVIMGIDYAYLGLRSKHDGIYLVLTRCSNAEKGSPEEETVITKLPEREAFLRTIVRDGAKYTFSYSIDGKKWIPVSGEHQAKPGKWIGAKIGLFSVRESVTNDSGFADIDWFRITK